MIDNRKKKRRRNHVCQFFNVLYGQELMRFDVHANLTSVNEIIINDIDIFS